MQKSLADKQKTSVVFNKDKIKELKNLQSLLTKNQSIIEEQPDMFGFNTPLKSSTGEVSKFSIGDMKNPQETMSQVSAAKPMTS